MILSIIRIIAMAVIFFITAVCCVVFIPFGKGKAYFAWVSGIFGRVMLCICGARPCYDGLEHLDPSKTYVFTGNHQSYVDIFLMFAALDSKGIKTLFMAKKELDKIPLFGMVMKQMGLIPIERGENRQQLATMLASMKTLADGRSLTIFAEGSRTYDGNLQPFKRGAFMLAEQADKEIVPFVITGTFNIWPRKGLRVRPGPCRISFMPPIDAKGIKSKELMALVEKKITDAYYPQKAEMDALWKAGS